MATQYSHSEQSLYPRHRPGVVSYLKLDVEKNKSGYYKKLYLYQSKKDFLNNCQANTSYCQTHKPLQEADGIYITDSQTHGEGSLSPINPLATAFNLEGYAQSIQKYFV